MKVYLVQHGEAKPAEEDPMRPLTARGEEEVKRVAVFLRRAGVKVGRVLHSGKLRASQTASIIAEAIGAKTEQANGLEPNADPEIWKKKLNEISEDVAIVGHLPHLSNLASLLLTGSHQKEIIGFRYGGIACIEKRDNSWIIQWIIRPDLPI